MRAIKGLLATVLLAASFAANTVPAVWVDYIDFNPDIKIGGGHSYPYHHDITNDGYDPGTDLLLGYELWVNLYDDGDRGLEVALINSPGILGDTLFFDLSGTEFGGWSIVGYLELLLTGLYHVNITSITGDFYLSESLLYAWGEDFSTSVPEPATLSLFGLGLLGLGFMARRRRV